MEIWDAKGNKVLDSVVTQNAEHVEELMQADYVSLQWVSNVKRVLPAGAYIVPFDDGVRYMLLDPYTPDQNNTDEFTYSPQFQHPKMYLGRVPYSRASKDTEGNDINLLDWDYKGYLTTFLSDLCGFITKTFTDEGITTDKFSYSVLGDIEGNVTISISNNDILSVLNNVCNTLDCEWHIDWEQRRLFVGNVRFDKNEGEMLELTSGVNVGMASVSSQSDTYYNVYLPQGSTRNMAAATSDGSYYATNRRLELDPEKYPDGKIYTDGGGNVVTKEQFLEAKLPKLVQTLMLDEIYPKIDLYVYDVRNRERYLLDDNGDKVIDHYEGETPVYKRYAIWYMRLAYPIYNTDGTIRSWKDATLGDTFKLIDGYTLMCSFGANTDSTLTSPLAGREFELNYVETDKEAKELSAKADSDKGDTGVEVKKGDYEIIYTTEGNLIIPTTEEQGLVPKGESSPSKNGNKVTIFNVVMGEDFIKAAQNDLEVAAIREIKKQYSDLNQYTFNSDNVAFKKDMPSLYIGRSIKYNDGVGNTLDTRIMKLTTKLDFPFMVEITVGNKVLKGSTSQLKTDVQMILSGNRQTASNGITESVVRSLIKGFGGANFLSKVNDDTARGIITFLQGTNWGSFTSETGAAMTVDPTTGQTYMEVDRLKVRLKAFFEQLEVQKVGYVGGKIVVSKGQGVDILDVEEIYDSEGNLSAYRCYFLGEQEGRRINNLLRVNDQMICKDENISEGSTDGATNKYYWRLVTAVSSDVVKRGNNVCHWVDLSATDCDTGSDIPEIGDTICHLGNRTDVDRQGAEILSVVDANSPSFTIYAGINSYSLVNKEYIDMGVAGGKAFCNIYGSTYIGDRNRENGYISWDYDKEENVWKMRVKGTIDITSPLSSGGTIGGAIDNAANAYKGEFDAFTSNVNEVIGGFQAQIDGVIETWFYDPEPTLGNLPASEWKDNTTKDKHLGDLYYSKSGLAYRFQKEGDIYKWVQIDDTAITSALKEAKAAKEAAATAQGTADTAQTTAESKMKVFVVQPTNNDEYSIGDMWVNATYSDANVSYSNDILKCKEGKAAGAEFKIAHWEKASKYTDDTKANEALTKVGNLQTDVTELGESFDTLTNTTLPALSDGIITTSEKENIRQALMQVQKECVDVINAYTNLTVNYESIYDKIAADVRTNFATAYTNLMGSATLSSDGTITYTSGQGGAYGALVDNINTLLNKEGNLTTNEIATINNNIANFNIKYNDFQNRLVVVRNDIEKTLDTRITKVDEQLGGYAYLKKIVGGKTTIDGGLVLTTMLGTGYEVTGGAYKIMSGISGLYETAKSVAIWAGGSMIDKFVYYDAESGKFNVPADVNPANFLVRMDGTGYAAGGNFWWDNDGKIHADPQSFLINEQYVGNVMQLFQLHYKVAGDTAFTNVDYVTPTRMFNGLELSDLGLKIGDTAKFYIKDGVLFLEGDLAVTGGITMYATDGVTSGLLDQVYAILDSSKFEIENGVITIKGEIGDGKVKGATLGGVAVTLNANGILEFDAYPTTLPASDVYAWAKAATKPTYSWGEITDKPSTFTPVAHTHDDRYYTETEIDTKLGLKLDTSLKGVANGLATLDASGKVPSAQLPSYVDDVIEHINKASFPTTGESGKIYIDQTTNLTYRWGGTAYVEISQSLALGETSSTAYAGNKGKQNAADIAALKTDKADKATTLSGYGITDAYTKTEVNTKLTDGSVTKIGTKDVGSATLPIYLKAGVPTAVGTSLAVDITGNSATTSKLKTAVTLWGQSFDGSKAITGNLTNVGTITPTGEDLKVVGNLIVTGGIVMYADDGATIESGFAALLAAHIDGVTIKYNEAQQKIYSVMTGIKVNGATYKPSETDGYITIPDYPTSLDWENIENKPSTFTPASHTHTFASLTSKPTTLSGYGITDAKIANGVITLGTATITPLTAHQTVTLASGTNNGTLKLTVGSKTTDNIAVKGLGSAAYTASSAYAAASHTHSQYLVASSLDGYINALTDNTSANVFVTAISKSGKTLSYTKSFTKKSLSEVSHSGWTTNAADALIIPDMSFIAYWNGAYNSSGGSNLAYCNKGAFGDMATAAKSSYYTKTEVNTKLGDGSVTKLGTGTTGAANTPIYWSNGKPAAVTLVDTANNLINSLTTGTTTPVDADYYIAQYAGGGTTTTTYHRRPHSALYAYIKGKAEGTWAISISGNAATASKLGTANVGSGTQHFYLSGGTATASTSTVGSASKPMYLKAGVMTACSYDFTSYLPLAGGTMAAGARISHADGNMYLGRSDNNGWVMCQDLCSQTAAGDGYWSLRTNGVLHAVSGVFSGNTTVGSLTVGDINVTKSSTGILKIDGNLVVTGGITMYATDGVASGLMEQILVDGTTIGKKADGTLYAINTGNVRSIIMGSTTYTPNDSGAVTLPEKVTWANIEGKPSTFAPSSHTHAISQITNLQATLDGKAAASHTHSYLPLSGGTISNDLTVNGQSKFKCGYFHKSNPTLGALSENTFVINPSSSSGNRARYGLYIWDDIFDGTAKLQSGYENGDTHPLGLALQPLGGNVGIGYSGDVRSLGYILSVNGSINGTSVYYNGNACIHAGNIGSQSVNYATNSTYLYASDSPYRYGDSSPYYMKMRYNVNNDYRWYLSVYPETPKYVAVDYSYTSGNADALDGLHAADLVRFYLSPLDTGASASSAKSWFTNTMPSGTGGIIYNVPGSEKTIIAGKSTGAYGHLLQLNYDDTYLRILRYYNGSWKSTDWEKISAGYADSSGNADTLDGNHASAFATAGHTHSYLPLSGGTMTGAINLSNANAKLAFGVLTTSPITGYKAPALLTNGVGIYSRYGGSNDEGAIIITEDTCVIYNSADTGWNFQVMDKDLGTDLTNDATRSFGVNQAHQAWSLAGFVKSGSSDSYVLLGGGGHKLISDFATSSHTHSYLPLGGGTLTGALTISAGITSTSAFVNTGDSTLKVYSGRITDAKSDGNICLQTSIDGTDGQSHAYPTQYGSRCNLVLQPRGGQVYIGTNPDGGNTSYKLYVNGGVYASSFTGNASSATKLTSSAGSATLPIYFSDGKPVACTASSVFSNLSNSGNNISVTVAGQNRTLTVGYADTVDGYHANKVYNAPTFIVNNANTSNTYVLLATITISGTSLACAEFTTLFQNRECLDNSSFILSGAIRRNSTTNVGATLSYITLHTGTPRNIYMRSDDGVTFRVYIQSVSGSWTTYYRAIPVVDSGNITYSNTGTTSPISGSVLNIAATKGGNVNYANSAGNSDTCDGLHVHGGRNNEANKIVRTDGSGYLQVGYINSSNGDEGNNSSPARVWGTNGSDSYMRTYLTSALSVKYAASAGNADTVDGYHASALWRSNGATWNPDANVSLTASANNQEWSFDIRRNGHTGCYWHVWDSSLNSMLKVTADNGKVYAPYNFVGNLEGNASTASKWATARTLTLTGSVTGSVSIDGSGNVSLATTTNHTHAYLPLSGGTMTGTINANDNVQNTGIKFKNNNANLNALTNQHLILGTAIRFGDYNTWDWNVWAGLKYDRANKTIYLGLADGTTFNANSAQSGGSIKFPGVSNLYISEIDDAAGGNGLIAYKPATWTGVSSSQTGVGTITTETVIRSSNSNLKHYKNGVGTYTIWDSGNHGSGSGLNADLLDGVHYLNILEREYTGSKYDSSATTKIGWYRIAECYTYSKNGFLLYLGRNYHSSNNENYIFAITVSYSGNISINQIAGSANTRLITKIRVCWSNTSSNKAYVDFYVGTEAINGYFWYTVGSAKSYGTWSASPSTSGYNTVEFSTCNGMSSNKDFYISGQIAREGKNGNWVSGRTNAMIRQTTANDYSVFASVKTYAGSWEIGEYTASGERLLFTYVTDTNFNNGNNSYSGQISFESGGNIIASGGITMYSDLRKKNILSNEVLSVKEIAAAPLFRHTYKSDDNQYIHVGTSAQYWSGIHDNWFTRKDSEGYYQMELQNLGVAMGISLAREIVKYESKTDKKIRLMKKKINDLEEANKALDARIKELEERRTA